MTARAAVFILTLALAAPACAPKRPSLPPGAGTPFTDFSGPLSEATAACANISTVTAALGLSGRAGSTKLRGRIDAGFAAPADLRLEGVAPFGKPVFVLVSAQDRTTLVLPRDQRVLRGASASAIVDALAGVPLGGAELRRLVAGCGLAFGDATSARRYDNGWLAVDAGETTVYLRQVDGAWRVGGSARGAISVAYGSFSRGRATSVRVQTAPMPGGAASDLTLGISQLEINVPLEPAVFEYDVPRDWAPLTLDELRRAGPLGGGRP